MNWSLSLPMVLVALAFGYLLGSIPFGLILTRLAGLGDIRAIGSGNIGATNVLRTGNKKLAAATLLFDALKGTVAVLLAGWFAGTEAGLVAGLGAFLGHLFPVWLKFKGGKGVATYIGVLLGLWWPAAVAFCLIWLAVAFAFKISSLSAFVASAVVPVLIAAGALAFGVGDSRLALVGVVLTALLWWKHRANLQRLIAGTEPRIGQ